MKPEMAWSFYLILRNIYEETQWRFDLHFCLKKVSVTGCGRLEDKSSGVAIVLGSHASIQAKCLWNPIFRYGVTRPRTEISCAEISSQHFVETQSSQQLLEF